jgi:hypothetical protein
MSTVLGENGTVFMVKMVVAAGLGMIIGRGRPCTPPRSIST